MDKSFIKFYNLLFLCLHYVSCLEEDHESSYSMFYTHHHEETPRLEDFFWTGSGDGPLPPQEKVDPSSIQPAVVVTTTVMATVYLDTYPGEMVTDKTTGDCLENCGEPVDPGSLQPEISDDRRYWLLTVIQGSTPDNLQLRLAKLYQKAFLRQQEKHLGIIKSLDAPTPRRKHEVHSFKVDRDNNHTFNNASKPDIEVQNEFNVTMLNNTIVNNVRKGRMYLVNFHDDINQDAKEKSWILASPETVLKKREVTESFEIDELNDKELIEGADDEIVNGTIIKREIIKPEQQPPVFVHIQNITETPSTGTVEIIYIVLVGGRAVPAVVAARDMRLVRDAEVAGELNAQLTTKAEPYLKSAEGLAGEDITPSAIQGTELWALIIGSVIAVILLLLLLTLVCRLFRKKKSMSATSLRAYRDEMIREIERSNLRQVHEEKDGKLISVVSPSRTGPSSNLLPLYRASSASSTSTSSGVSEIAAAAHRRRQKKPHVLKMPQKRRVGTTDNLLQSVAMESSDSSKELSAPATPTSYLSMPSLKSFPRSNIVEPLSKVLEPISVRHLDIDSQDDSPKGSNSQAAERARDVIPRRQMASQLVRLGSFDKDPGVIGPMVWDLHCQRIKDGNYGPKPSSPATTSLSSAPKEPSISRMRQRFNELVDDAFSLFGSPSKANVTGLPRVVDVQRKEEFCKDVEEPVIAQARNDNVRLPGSPYTALDTVRGRSAGVRLGGAIRVVESAGPLRPQTSFPKNIPAKPLPTRAWDSATPSTSQKVPVVNPAFILSEGRLSAEDPATPLISAIKNEIQRVRENAYKHN